MLNSHVSLLLAVVIAFASTCGCSSLRNSKLGSGLRDGLFGRSTSDRDRERREELADAALDPLGIRDGNRLLLEDLAPDQLMTTLKVRSGLGRSRENAQAEFAKATQLYDAASNAKSADPNGSAWQEQFVEAANQFRVAGALWPDSTVEEKATFFEGESYFFADRYVQANRAFEKLIADYAGSSYLDRAEQLRYAISKYWLELSENGPAVALNDAKRPKFNLAGEARRVLHNIRLDDPTGKLSDDATFELGNAFLKQKRFFEAADTYEDLRLNYPRSKFAFDAMMLELEARLKSYQGPSYDPTPLTKGEELIKMITRQFPTESSQNKELLEQQASLVYNQLAQREYEVGKYHQRRGENRAAQLSFQKVAQDYPDSVFASSIGSDIQVVADGPAVPDQHAQWLVNLFPDPRADKPVFVAGDNESVFRR